MRSLIEHGAGARIDHGGVRLPQQVPVRPAIPLPVFHHFVVSPPSLENFTLFSREE